jgi:hypothetical protein
MKRSYRTNWNEESLLSAAREFDYREDFKKGNMAAYKAAYRRGLLDVVCAHMSPKDNTFWTPVRLKVEAAKYESRGQFDKGSHTAYEAARNLGILDGICSHMPRPKKWNYESFGKPAIIHNNLNKRI